MVTAAVFLHGTRLCLGRGTARHRAGPLQQQHFLLHCLVCVVLRARAALVPRTGVRGARPPLARCTAQGIPAVVELTRPAPSGRPPAEFRHPLPLLPQEQRVARLEIAAAANRWTLSFASAAKQPAGGQGMPRALPLPVVYSWMCRQRQLSKLRTQEATAPVISFISPSRFFGLLACP